MLTSLEHRVSRLERVQPRPLPSVRLLDRRAPTGWVPKGIQRLTRKQSEIYLCPQRFRVGVSGRRGGKSTLAVAELLRTARSGYGRECWYIAPSYRMCKQILWGPLKSAIPAAWMSQKSEVDLSITLRGYGSIIRLRSGDNPDALRGSGLDLAILDEYSNIDPVTWSEVIRPALADKRGEALIMGSPRGYNALYDLYTQALETEDWAGFKFSTAEGGLVPPEEIEAVKATLDARTFGQEFEADFARSTNLVYLMFSREGNVRSDLSDPGATVAPLPESLTYDYATQQEHQRARGELLVGIDFNINPLAAVVGLRAGDELHIVDEVALFNSNTQELAEVLKQKYPGRQITVYPDPSGNARKTSAPVGQTDFSILRHAGFRLVAPAAAPPVVDRVNDVNAMLCNAQGRRRLFIHPKCTYLIRALEQLPYKEGTSQPDKSLGIEHHADGLGYLIHSEFPIVSSTIGFSKLRGY